MISKNLVTRKNENQNVLLKLFSKRLLSKKNDFKIIKVEITLGFIVYLQLCSRNKSSIKN